MNQYVSRYGAPEPSYSAPEPSYGAPEVSYTAPASYEPEAYAAAPSQEYSSPAYTAEGEVLDIQSLVLPILVIVGEDDKKAYFYIFFYISLFQ